MTAVATSKTLSSEATRLWGRLDRSHRGLANAVRQEEIGRALGIHSRKIQALMGELIESGRPVASSCTWPHCGVFVPDTEEEKNKYYKNLRSRAISLLRRMKYLRRAPTQELLRRLGEGQEIEQLEMFDI